MSENLDYIQLPPMKRDTPTEVVSMIWEYLKLPKESRERVKAEQQAGLVERKQTEEALLFL